MTREPGFYWVKTRDEGWEVAQWMEYEPVWWRCMNEIPYTDDYFDEINETRLISPQR